MVVTDEERIILRYLKKERKQDREWLQKQRDELIEWLQHDECVDDFVFSRYIEARDNFLATNGMYYGMIDTIQMRALGKI